MVLTVQLAPKLSFENDVNIESHLCSLDVNCRDLKKDYKGYTFMSNQIAIIYIYTV